VPPKDKKFVNPLLRSTEPSTETNTETPTQESTETLMKAVTQAPTSTSTSAHTFTSQDDEQDYSTERRKRGKQAFDKTHIRWTMWIKKGLKKKIEKLAKDQELSLVALAEEAFTDLLQKYEDKK
jgi:predicted HicB family RNase H-like nuclease